MFELHILPLIRATDREHMQFAYDLWDYDQLVKHADDFATRVATDMPPVGIGGPWPEEWVALFRRWMTMGFKRLELGAAAYSLNRTATVVTVRATGSYPDAGYNGWLQLEWQSNIAKQYVLYFEAPDTAVHGRPGSFDVRERYRVTDTRSVSIRDRTGIQQLT